MPGPHDSPDDLAHLGRGWDEPPAATDAVPADGAGDTARAARRRQGAAVAVGALVVAAALVAITLPDTDEAARDRDDRPTVPSSRPPPSDYVQQSSATLIADPQSRVRDIGIADDGTVAAVWEYRDRTSQALAVDHPDGSTYVTDPLQPLLSLTPAPGGLLTLRDYYSTVGLLRPYGGISPITVDDAPVEPEPGDVAVDLGTGPRIFRPEEATVYGLPALRGASARAGYVTPEGALVVATAAEGGQTAGTAVWRDGAWDLSRRGRGPATSPGLVAGNGDSVAVVSSGDQEGGQPDPVALVLVSHDGGRRWREVPVRADVSGSTSTVAVADDGTVLLADDEGHVTAVRRDGAWVRLAAAPAVQQLQSVGGRVWGLGRSGGRGPLWWTDDAGATWHRAPLPGLH